MQTYNNSVVLKFDTNTTGNSDSGAPITVRVASTGVLATIYDLQENQILNPLTTDNQGNYSFKAEDGVYNVIIREGQANEYTLFGIKLNDTPIEEAITDHALSINRDEDDAHPISAITGLLEIIEELQMASSSTSSASITTQPNYPYEWSFPINEVQQKIMEKQAGNNSIGDGGSTWWVRPVAVGRVEDGVDCVYLGTTFGSPEDRERVPPTGEDPVVSISKRSGQAIISVAKVSVENANGTDYVTFEKRGINDKLAIYREDEHHQPMVMFNPIIGQLITSWGSRNSARDQNGTDEPRRIVHIRYGQSLDNLSSSETPGDVTTIDYSQGIFVGSTSFIFARSDVGNWSYTSGTAGQNYSNFVQFINSQTEQYYIATSEYDTKLIGYNIFNFNFRPQVHMFGAAHPTINPDRVLRYLHAEFVVAGSELGTRNGGGLFFERPTDNTPPNGNGKLGDMTVLTKDLFETAYTAPVGRTYRLLDVQYGQSPRALIGEFNFDWAHGASIPFGRTWDLKLIQFNKFSKTWSAVTLKVGLRGMLGYKPEQAAYDANVDPIVPFQPGMEGYTSGYLHGASFWRGKNGLDTRPIVYFCDRVGDDQTNHRLKELLLTDDYSGVSTETVLIDNSINILYRPEMTLAGNKRFLWYNEAQGWSNFNSFVAQHKWIDMTPGVIDAAPVINIQPVDTTGANGDDILIGLEASSYGGDKLTYKWYFSNVGDGGAFSLASATGPSFIIAGSAGANGRQYYCEVVNSTGTTTSTTITVTVTGV